MLQLETELAREESCGCEKLVALEAD